MDETFRAFGSHADADRAGRLYYESLTPAERLDILLELVARHQESLGEPAKGFERVYRVIELPISSRSTHVLPFDPARYHPG